MIIMMGNSYIKIGENSDISSISTMEHSTSTIENATIENLRVYDSSIITATKSNIKNVDISAFNPNDYSIKLYNSTVTELSTYSWGSL